MATVIKFKDKDGQFITVAQDVTIDNESIKDDDGIAKIDSTDLKAKMHLNKVDNTTDLEKPISTQTQAAITNEANRAIAAEGELQENIDTEASTRATADNTLQSNINAEVTRATAAEQANATAISTEKTRSEGAEATLQTNITTETTRATTKENALQTSVDNINDVIPDDATSENQLATEGYVDLYGGKIDKIFVNGTEQTIKDKEVKITDVASATGLSSEITTRASEDARLDARIDSVESRGRLLSIWYANNHTMKTYPVLDVGSTYLFKTGDYFIVGTVGTTNYKPKGTGITRESQTVYSYEYEEETETVKVNDTYIYDGSTWMLLHPEDPNYPVKDVKFKGISVVDSNDIAILPETLASFTEDATHRVVTDTEKSTWNAKQNAITSDNKLSSDLVDDTDKTHKFVTETEKTTWSGKSVVSVSDTGTSTTTGKYITVNGDEYKLASDPDEYTTKLKEDLYAYTNIGKISASKTNPVKVADAGDPLKDVFNAILGTQEDTNPTINISGTTFTKSNQTGATSVSGAEFGTAISALTGTVTFKVTNTAICSYGLKAGSNDTYSKTATTTFNYPIKTRSVTVSSTSYNYQIAISYPALNGCSLSITAGTLVKDDTSNRVLYCNLNTSNIVTVSISIPAGTSTLAAQTRFGVMTANVEFNKAQYNNVDVDNFWTYLKNSYTASGLTPPSQKSATSTAYTITTGTYYPYYIQSDSVTVGSTLSGATKSTDAVCYTNGADYTISKKYFMFVIPNSVSKSTIQQYITGQWNGMNTTSLGTTTLTLNSGATATYKVYRTDELVLSSTLKLRIN